MINTLNHRLSHTGGYTIDQTILIVAIIAILVTIIILTVGWNLINRAEGTKLASQLKQVEDAIGQFYGEHKIWPTSSYTSPAYSTGRSALALANAPEPGWVWDPAVMQTQLRNLVPGFVVGNGGTALLHGFSGNGDILVADNRVNIVNWASSTGLRQYAVVVFRNVPVAAARNAEEVIDGTNDAVATEATSRLTGRLVYGGGACDNATRGGTAATPGAIPANNMVNVCYAANLME